MNLIGYSDSDWDGRVDDSRSTSGYLFYLGTSYFSYSSKKQEITAQLIPEVEYIIVVNQIICLRKINKDLGHEQTEATKIICDNSSIVSISKNQVFHGRTKHVKIKFHFIREV